MADSQGLTAGDTGYDPFSDPDNPLYGQPSQSASPTAGGGTTQAPTLPSPGVAGPGGTTTAPGAATGPADATDQTIGGQTVTNTATGSEIDLLQGLLARYPNDPAGAVSLFNQQNPNSTLRPQYYADRRVIGVAGQSLPYLTAPGTTPGQTTWDFGGVPGGDSAQPPPSLNGGGMLDIWPGYKQPTGPPQPWQAPSPYPNFTAPTPADVRAGDPSYDFDLNEGIGALTNSAAAKGVVRGGGTLRGIESLGTNFADQQFGNIYNRDLGTYIANKGTYDMNTANSRQSYLDARQSYLDAYGIFNDNRKDSLNQLDILYGAGANAAGNA